MTPSPNDFLRISPPDCLPQIIERSCFYSFVAVNLKPLIMLEDRTVWGKFGERWMYRNTEKARFLYGNKAMCFTEYLPLKSLNTIFSLVSLGELSLC